MDNIVIKKKTYFYLEEDTVMVSLKEWNENIEPVSSLVEEWVQVTRIPPKWCDWLTLRHILRQAIGSLVYCGREVQ